MEMPAQMTSVSGAIYRWWAYIKAAGIEDDRKGLLFRSAVRKTKKLTASPMTRKDVWCMVRRRVSDAGIATAIGCHSFRAPASPTI
jgi:site-specific recombinase XerD